MCMKGRIANRVYKSYLCVSMSVLFVLLVAILSTFVAPVRRGGLSGSFFPYLFHSRPVTSVRKTCAKARNFAAKCANFPVSECLLKFAIELGIEIQPPSICVTLPTHPRIDINARVNRLSQASNFTKFAIICVDLKHFIEIAKI